MEGNGRRQDVECVSQEKDRVMVYQGRRKRREEMLLDLIGVEI